MGATLGAFFFFLKREKKEVVFVNSILDFGEEEGREFASLLLSYTET